MPSTAILTHRLEVPAKMTEILVQVCKVLKCKVLNSMVLIILIVKWEKNLLDRRTASLMEVKRGWGK